MPSRGATEADHAAIVRVLGREPITDCRVAVRCPHGGPAVIESKPRDLRGRPFPTRNWLGCKALTAAVSRLEADGGVSRLAAAEELRGALRSDHDRHRHMHDGHLIAGVSDLRHPKCLHAHLAFGLATGGGPVSAWIWEESGAEWPAVCCAELP